MKKNIRILSENFQILVVKFSIYLPNKRMFVMSLRWTLSDLYKSRTLLSPSKTMSAIVVYLIFFTLLPRFLFFSDST